MNATAATSARTSLWTTLLTVALSGGFVAVGFIAAGATLGVFLAGIFAAAILVPILASADTTWRDRARTVLGVTAGAAIVWIYATIASARVIDAHRITWTQWLACVVLLAAWAAMLAFGVAALRSFRVNSVAASSIVVLLAIAWLAWPLWLAPRAGSASRVRISQVLVPAYVPLAMDGVIVASTNHPWPEHRILYSQTTLGEDISYALPGFGRSVSIHAALAALLFGIAAGRARMSGREKK